MQDQLQQLTQMRQHSLEQYAQINSELDLVRQQKHKLQKRATLILEDLRELTAKINQINNELSAKAEKEKAQHDVSSQAETSPG